MAAWEMRWLISSWPVVSLIWLGSAGFAARPRSGAGRAHQGERGPGQIGDDPGAELVRAQGPLAEVAPLDAVAEPGLDAVGAPDRRLVDALVDQELAGVRVMSSGSPGLGGGGGGRPCRPCAGRPAPKRRAKTSNSSFACGGSGSPCRRSGTRWPASRRRPRGEAVAEIVAVNAHRRDAHVVVADLRPSEPSRWA